MKDFNFRNYVQLVAHDFQIERFIKVFLTFALLFFVYWLALQAINRLKKRLEYSGQLVAKTFVALVPLFKFFLHFLLLISIAHFFIGDLHAYFQLGTNEIVRITFLVIVGISSYIFVSILEEHMVQQQSSKFDVTAVQTFTKLARVGIIILFTLTILPHLGIEISGILTLGAAGSVVIGLASKEWLSNFFGGLMIFVDKPFGVGDWIKCNEKNIEGVVINIGWRLTCIRTFEYRPVYVPNSFFAQTSIENPSRMENRRLRHAIHLPYKDHQKIPLIINDIKGILKTCPNIDQTKPVFVHVTRLATSSVECLVYCYTRYTEWGRFLETQQEVMLGILQVLEDNQSSYGIPISDLRIEHVR